MDVHDIRKYDDDASRQRAAMVAQQIEARGIRDPRVLDAMRNVPRERFVPENLRAEAYQDRPLPIGSGQTISQPYTVAMMCEALKLTGTEKILEIGTGSGYCAAVLSLLASEVHTMERIPDLVQSARERIEQLGIPNVFVHHGDGSNGLPSEALFDAIIVTAGSPSLPQALADQLSEGGRIVIPVGSRDHQTMCRFTRHHNHLHRDDLGAFCFVPLIGDEAWSEQEIPE